MPPSPLPPFFPSISIGQPLSKLVAIFASRMGFHCFEAPDRLLVLLRNRSSNHSDRLPHLFAGIRAAATAMALSGELCPSHPLLSN
jgi:hypothetical protein